MQLIYKTIKTCQASQWRFNPFISIRFTVWLFIIITSVSCRKGSVTEFSVKTGSFRQSVIETGELMAVKASYIVMPQINWQYGYQFKIVGLAENGKNVQKGDSVVSVDASSIHKFILDRESMLENEKAASKKQKVEMENKIQELNAQLKSEQASFDLKKLELERIQFDTESKRKIKELEFKQATIRLNKIKRNLELRPKLNIYDSKIQDIKVIQRESEIQNAKETLDMMVIHSPQEGLFQVKTNWNGQNIKLGDNTYLGSMIASIPDIRLMKVNTYVNETDIVKVSHGMKVIVRLDALPNVPFNGIVSKISKICTEREKEKVFDIVVEIPETDLRLKPGMTVSSEFISYESEKELFVPNNCLLKERGHSYIFLNKGRSPQKVEVETGPANTYYTIIKSDLKAGQELVPFEKIQEIKK
jgi:hypothetical protein